MEEKSDTPRTGVLVPSDELKRLQNERDEARAEVDRLRKANEELYNGMMRQAIRLAATEARPATPDGLPTYDKEKALEWVAQLRDGNKEPKP